ncbi:WD40 repeat domain-containing protein [Lichenihabitans psoromatis]|uniref:WD40 repeat domain-containing protein n=1 Tax=Lichenihabitans psoromatis TaxID=2528642 RepID=UPI0010359B71|nr:WD40 repeat domain-containing protein [Lichenihabitans psoromatis]
MTAPSVTPTDSLTSLVQPIEAGAHVTAAAFLGRTPALALGDGTVVLAPIGEERRISAHPEGAILAAAAQGSRMITGGDDGRLVATSADGSTQDIAHEVGKWIDALAVREDGTVAWAAGRQVRSRSPKGEVKSWLAPTSARGLAFAPKGYRLAVSHYNGATLWYPNTASIPEVFEWKGSHLDVTVSPDNRFLVTSMQENSLHGWRLADGQHMRMQGYPSKSRSLAWSHDGDWLATSGADACVVWPFDSKTGPMGKAPRECGVRSSRVSQVAFHPKTLVLAMGYEDGFVLLCRLTDASEILVRKTDPGTADPVSALAWDRDGKQLLFGTRKGAAGLLTLPG